MADPIDTDAVRSASVHVADVGPLVHALCDEVDRLRAENESAPDRFARERLTGAYDPSVCRETDRVLITVRDEVRRLRDAIAAIPRHVPYDAGAGEFTHCVVCEDPDGWPCPTEQAHRLLEADRG